MATSGGRQRNGRDRRTWLGRPAIFGRLLWPDAPADLNGATVVCHEWLVTMGGSDKVAAEITGAVDADYMFVLAADPELVDRLHIKVPVIESRIGRHVRHDRRWQWLLPVMPLIWASLDLRSARSVVTSSHAFVNFVRGSKACYCHTPMRYAWEWRVESGRIPRPMRGLWLVVAGVLRRLDHRASRSVDIFIANSVNVRDRIARCYGRQATVVHPPIDLDWWTPALVARSDFVLVAGRMVGYKRPELAVLAARMSGRRVVVAGSGPCLAQVECGPDVEIIVSPTDQQLRHLYRTCLALIFPAIEDLGMVPIEAQACGAPVVGIRTGGTLETVRDGETGILVEEQTAAALATAIRQIADAPFVVLPNATARFGRERFIVDVLAALDGVDGR